MLLYHLTRAQIVDLKVEVSIPHPIPTIHCWKYANMFTNNKAKSILKPLSNYRASQMDISNHFRPSTKSMVLRSGFWKSNDWQTQNALIQLVHSNHSHSLAWLVLSNHTLADWSFPFQSPDWSFQTTRTHLIGRRIHLFNDPLVLTASRLTQPLRNVRQLKVVLDEVAWFGSVVCISVWRA